MTKMIPYLMVGCLILSGCQQVPAIETSSEEQTSVPISSISTSTQTSEDLMELGRLYLDPIFQAGIAETSWESPTQIDADTLLTFYLQAINCGMQGFSYPENYTVDDNLEYHLPADIVESAITKSFDVTPERLRTSEHYDAKTNTYITFGVRSINNKTVTNVSLLDGIMTIDFDIYQDDVQLQTGSLRLKQNGDTFQYISCDIQKGDNTIPARYEMTETIALGMADAPVKNLNDLEEMAQVYVRPIDTRPSIWFDSWNAPSEINATILINICAMNNFLDLPVDFEGCYLESEAPAEQVETSIQDHFDVTSEYLRTSELFNAQNNKYALMSNTGPNGACVLSAKQDGNKIVIRTGIQSFWETGEGPVRYTKLIPTGTLTVKLDDKNVVHYISFQKDDAFDGHAMFS